MSNASTPTSWFRGWWNTWWLTPNGPSNLARMQIIQDGARLEGSIYILGGSDQYTVGGYTRENGVDTYTGTWSSADGQPGPFVLTINDYNINAFGGYFKYGMTSDYEPYAWAAIRLPVPETSSGE